METFIILFSATNKTCPNERTSLNLGLTRGVFDLKKLLLTAALLLGTNANAEQQTCSQAVSMLSAMAVAGAHEEILKYSLNDGLNGRVTAEEERAIYLETMRAIYVNQGFILLGKPHATKDLEATVELIICDYLALWPED